VGLYTIPSIENLFDLFFVYGEGVGFLEKDCICAVGEGVIYI
jgi:hypothetical protein